MMRMPCWIRPEGHHQTPHDAAPWLARMLKRCLTAIAKGDEAETRLVGEQNERLNTAKRFGAASCLLQMRTSGLALFPSLPEVAQLDPNAISVYLYGVLCTSLSLIQ